MKFLIAAITSVVAALLLAATGFSPFGELRQLYINKHKIFISGALFAAAIVFALAAFMIALIEGALQYDAQGFVMWSALFAVALLFCGLGVVAFFVARTINPLRVLGAHLDQSVSEIDFGRIVHLWTEMRAATPPARPTSERFEEVYPWVRPEERPSPPH